MHNLERFDNPKPDVAAFAVPGLGRRLKELRRQIGVSAREVCADLSINAANLYRWENEQPQRTPGIEKIRDIVDILVRKGVVHPIHRSKQRGHILEYLIWGE